VIRRLSLLPQVWIHESSMDVHHQLAVRMMKQNPSLQVGIDGSMDPRGRDPRDQNLSDRRVGAVRDALIQAGVPASKIQTGAFGDTRLARDRRVEVLVKTGN
jgi:outer membrane protein OmpA-like peptidoglycan-associated protein